jgi:hypothetical protein
MGLLCAVDAQFADIHSLRGLDKPVAALSSVEDKATLRRERSVRDNIKQLLGAEAGESRKENIDGIHTRFRQEEVVIHDKLLGRTSSESQSVDEQLWRNLTGTSLPTPAVETTCDKVTVDFDALPDGTTLPGGLYVHKEWFDAYGLTLWASGGLKNYPRLFNTSDVGSNGNGDPDLGAPNKRCSPPGPGEGEGGEPDMPGANCEPQGNVLIVQEDNGSPARPDDSGRGGTITFTFSPLARSVVDIGLMDIDEPGTTIDVTYVDASGLERTSSFNVTGLGANPYKRNQSIFLTC